MKYAAALILSAIFWLFAWYLDTASSVVAIWERSDTYAHGYLILPISMWMIWHRRRDLAALAPRPDFLALPLLALAGFGWLLGQLAGVDVVQQYALVCMIPLLVWIVLGRQIVWTLAFPLFFLLFAVPFGEFLVPPLMEQTANFTVFALRLSGVPVYREGLYFTVPSGNWSVVEACSGLRYLIASLTLGLLYAYLTYRSLARRAIFIAASLIVPIVANWLRAYMIVMIGHLSGMKYAVGIDHLIYGWLFFGLVMLILFWAGSFWREDLEPPRPAPDSVRLARRADPSLWAIIAATIVCALTVAIWPVAAVHLEGTGPYPPLALEAPPPVGGWNPVGGRLAGWSPRFVNPRAQVNQTYAKGIASAGLYIGFYRNQRQGAELITSQNTLLSGSDREWANLGETGRMLVAGNQEIASIEAKLRGRSSYLLVWRWYWVDGRYTVNSYRAKLLQAKSMLLGSGDDGAVVIIYAPYAGDAEGAALEMQDFVSAMLPAISRTLDHARRPGS